MATEKAAEGDVKSQTPNEDNSAGEGNSPVPDEDKNVLEGEGDSPIPDTEERVCGTNLTGCPSTPGPVS